MDDLSAWTPCPRPSAPVLEGRFVRLERLSPSLHGDGLFAAASMEDGALRFRWLPEYPPENRGDYQAWLDNAEASPDPLYYAVIDRKSGCVAGRQTFLRIDQDNGVIEIGHILWSSIIARKPGATEAFYLFAQHIFDDLGYRRFEWKCNDRNLPSKRAAERFGMTFEGVFRQAAIVKGENRDTAWYSMIDREWPTAKAAFETWLSPGNFGEDGEQVISLSALPLREMRVGDTVLRRLVPAPVSAVSEFQKEAYARTREATGTEPLPLMIDYADPLPDCETWIAADADGLAAVLILRLRLDDIYLESIATHPRVSGQGIGAAMMKATMERAKQLRRPAIRLMTNALNPAREWYRRIGFTVESEETLSDRKALHMALRL